MTQTIEADAPGLAGAVPLPILLTPLTSFTEEQGFDPLSDPETWESDMSKTFRYDPETQLSVAFESGKPTVAIYPTCNSISDDTCCYRSCGIDTKVFDRINDDRVYD